MRQIDWKKIGDALLFTTSALALCALPLVFSGGNAFAALSALARGAVGGPNQIADSLARSVPLMMTGLGVALCFRAGFFNIGAEGQFLLGALAAAGAGAKMGWPAAFVLLAGSVAGALWALIAGLMKTRRGAPEIISTIMLNYVALQLVSWSLRMPENENDMGGWLLEQARTQPQSDVLPPGSQLPALVADSDLHAGSIVALGCALACWWLLFHTRRGFELRAVGLNPLAARAGGIESEAQTLWAVAVGGALCGLGGAMEIAGATKQMGLAGFGYGYTAIAVALLGGINPLGVLPAALLFGMLDAGGKSMEREANVPAVAVFILTGVVLFAVAIAPRLFKRRAMAL